MDNRARSRPFVPIIGRVTAYVDESLRLTGEGLYVLAAVVVPADRAAEVRAALRDAVPPGLRRYHWRKEGAASRARMVAAVAALDVASVVVTSGVAPARQERARRRCLTRLLWELAQRDVATLVFETRQRHADASDRELLRHAERAGWAPRTRYAFRSPEDEPLLWLPDVVAGAVARSLGDGDGSYVSHLAARLTVVAA